MFDEMKSQREMAMEYYPEEYFTNKMPKDEKLKLKEEISLLYLEVKGYWRSFFGIRGSIQRKSTNYMVQCTSADETKTALVMIRKNLIEENPHLKLINSVHDEILVETTREGEDALKDGELLASLMVKGANVYLEPPIMTSNPEVGSCWVH